MTVLSNRHIKCKVSPLESGYITGLNYQIQQPCENLDFIVESGKMLTVEFLAKGTSGTNQWKWY